MRRKFEISYSKYYKMQNLESLEQVFMSEFSEPIMEESLTQKTQERRLHMEKAQEHEAILESLKEKMAFLESKMEDKENAEDVWDSLGEILKVFEGTIAYMESTPPHDSSAKDGEAAQRRADGAEDEEESSAPAEKPEDPDDLEGWMAFFSENPDDEDAKKNIQRIESKARMEDDWETIVDVLLGRVAASEDKEYQVEKLKEVELIYEQEIGDLGKAFYMTQMAHSLEPTDEDLIDELLRLAEATEQWADLVAHLNEIIPAIEDKKTAAKLWLQAARIYSERLEHPDYAISALGTGLEADPQNPELWDAMATIYKANEKWGDLAQVLRRRLDLLEEEEQTFFMMELAELYETRLGDPNEARIFYERVLEKEPENVAALAALEGICRMLELWEPLVKVLRKSIELAEEPESARNLRRQMADILLEHLEDPKTAAVEYESVLEEEPDDEEVLRKLCDIYEEQDRPKDYLRVAERLADIVEDTKEQIALYRRLVIEMEMDDDLRSRTTEILENILTLDPGDDVVYRSLEKRYIEEEDWEHLASVYQRHVENASSNAVKMEILKALSSVQDEQQGKIDEAIETLETALEIDGSEMEVLSNISGLYRRNEDWVKLVDILSQRAELAEEDTERGELHRQIGEIAGTKLGDPEEAENRLMKALELDAQNLGVVTALYQLYRSKEEWFRAAKMLDQAQELTNNPIQRAQTLYEAGELYEEEIEDKNKAIELWRKAIQCDPGHVAAADKLQEHHFANEEWDEAEPLLDLLTRRVDEKDRKKGLLYHSRLGLVARFNKDVEKAIKHLEKARELDPSRLDVLDALADLKYTGEDWKSAANLYQAILVGHRQDLDDKVLVEIYHRLGTVKLNSGNKEKALNLFDKALELDPEYEPSAQAVIDLRSESKDYDKVAATKMAMLKKAKSDEDRRKLLLEIADLYMEQLGDNETALDYFDEALKIKPDDHSTLHKIMEIYTSAEDWENVANTVLRLADIEDNDEYKAKYYYTAAVIFRDELNYIDRALEEFDRALDINPHDKVTFEAVERILSDEGRWKELGRAYRQQFKRLPENTPANKKVDLLHKMGTIYLEKLGEIETAIAAFEGAVALEATNADRNETLAKLYVEAGPDKIEKAIEINQLLLKSSPYRVSVYKTLCDLYIQSRQKDKTWCLCAALTFLKQADEKQKIFYDRYKPKNFVKARRTVTDKLWRDNLAHESENVLLNSIMAGICVPAAILTAQQHKAYSLKRRERVAPEKDGRLFPKLFLYSANTLEIGLRPELFIREDQILPIQLANTKERSSLVPSWLVDLGKFEGKNEKEVVYEISRQLAFLRPQRYLRRALPSRADLANALGAAVAIMVPESPIDKQNPGIKKYMEHFAKTVPPMVFEQLTPIAKKLLAAGAEAASIPKWLTATDLTALQAGLTLCNDFSTVAKQVASESDGVTGIPAKERITNLLLFSVSERYFELRDHLGFSVE